MINFACNRIPSLGRMDSESQPLAASSTELYSQEVTATDSAFSHESHDPTGPAPDKGNKPWYSLPKRHIIAIMAFLGFGEAVGALISCLLLYPGQSVVVVVVE